MVILKAHQALPDEPCPCHPLHYGEELVPSHITFATLDGGNPIKVWREYRGLTVGAEAAGITLSELTQLLWNQKLSATPHIYAVGQPLDLALDGIGYFYDRILC